MNTMQTSQKNEENISTKNVRLKDTKGKVFPSLQPAGQSFASPSPSGNAPKTPRKSTANYAVLDEFTDGKIFDENYALASHYIQLQDSIAGEKYRKILEQNGLDVSKFPETDDFNAKLDVPFGTSKNPSFTFIDLFAGIGGFRLAMQSCGGQCVFSSEWDNAAKQTYFENYGEVPFGDITKLETKDFIPEKFDVLCAGFPCQPFSNAGLKKGIEDTRGTLFYHIAEILEKHYPKVVLLENVRGLISNDKGKTLKTILQTITDIGYKCNIPQEIIDNGSVAKLQKEASKMILSAKNFGVPQNRPRIYIILWKKELNIDKFEYPAPLNIETHVGDILIKDELLTAPFTISDKLWKGHQDRKIRNAQKGNGFGYCSFNSESSYTSTLSRRYYKDGSEILIEQNGKNPRKLTPREAARLQGYSDLFRLHPSNTESYKQFGNSVAVPVVTAISQNIVNQILGR